MSENLGVIQVDDGAGWKKGVAPATDDGKKHEHDSATIFKPIMEAIIAIRKNYPDYYIGLTYGANAEHTPPQTKDMFDLYGFSDSSPPKGPTTTINEGVLGKVNISKMLDIMKGGSGQAEVLYSDAVRKMLLDGRITDKFIIIPFDTMDSKKSDPDDAKKYGHKDDCIAFAEKFLNLPKSIIIGWRNGRSELKHLIDLPKLPTQDGTDANMNTIHFALGGGIAGIDGTVVDYINFLIQNWNRNSQKTINSLLKPVLPKKDDDKPPAAAAAAAAATPSVTAEEIAKLKARLTESKKITAIADSDKTAAVTIAEEIFNAFFGDGGKSKTKEFLTDRVDKLNEISIFSSDSKKKALLDSISTRLKSITVPATAAATTSDAKPVAKPVDPTTKYVFAFDIDGTLVRSGRLDKAVESASRHVPFNPSTDATDHEAMITLMKDIIDAGHHVWIVTANTKIAKPDFEANYLKGDTKKITENYYFMNPTTVNMDLKLQFVSDQILPYTGTTTTLDLTFDPTGDGGDFQTKGLKPYAMIAKWLEKNSDMKDVQMYLFDDSANYGTTCKNVKGDKIEFVKIGSPSPPPPGFKSDVLTEATKKFDAISTTKAPVTSGGSNLKVMTFNTWYEAFSPKDHTMYCSSKNTNKCTDTIMKTIVDRMKEGGPQVIFLQEFTSRFDEFFGKVEGVVVDKPAIIASTSKVQTTDAIGKKSDTDIPQLRHFTMMVDGKKFYVYTATIAGETITTIYSSYLRDASADAFFIGNTATVRKSPNNDNSPYFRNRDDKNYNKADQESWIFGGARPYIVLEFKDKKLVLINLHSHHDESFRPKEDGPAFTPDQLAFINTFTKESGRVNSVQTYAFSVLGNMLRDSTRIPTLDDYSIIIGGDFNAEPERTLKLLNLSLGSTKPFTNSEIDRKRVGDTCCITKEGDTFDKAGDQIYSRGLDIVKGSYTVHDVTRLEKGNGKTDQKYFSDHLPVYAEIILPSSSS